MSSRRLLFVLLACAAFAWSRAAETEKSGDSAFALQRPADFTKEQQEFILKAFIAAEKPLQIFVKHFPAATFSMLHPDRSEPRVIVASTLDLGRYSVSLVYSATFNADLTKLVKARCDLFGAYDNLRPIAPKGRRKPQLLPLADMERLGQAPTEYLDQLFGALPP